MGRNSGEEDPGTFEITIKGKPHTVATPERAGDYRVWDRPYGTGGQLLMTCQTALELRACLLALAYPEGNTPTP
ncbi:hypothetical protein [Methylobacterium sp. 285MFTsu5.1]|uniref:hypothetical protein n=1 Tax=Methylobacterium sp. 285MFTsu5.1 TaxID=1172187 RepID=UPI00037F5437|nr:hypothetical protein [Methylobacterium sp. 285MFTsu5.1]